MFYEVGYRTLVYCSTSKIPVYYLTVDQTSKPAHQKLGGGVPLQLEQLIHVALNYQVHEFMPQTVRRIPGPVLLETVPGHRESTRRKQLDTNVLSITKSCDRVCHAIADHSGMPCKLVKLGSCVTVLTHV